MSARSSRSSASSRAAATRLRACGVCPAAQALRAAAYRRPARGCSPAVSSAARSYAAAAAAYPPRRSARAPAASRSATTASSGPSTAAARCHAYRSGSSAGSRASARARCASRRSLLVAAWYTADRTSGCRTRTLSPSTTTSPDCSATSMACGATSRTAAARRTVATWPESSAAATSSRVCTAGGSRRHLSRKTLSTPVVRCSCAGIGAAPASCCSLSVVGSSTSASGFPAAWVISRATTSSATVAPAAWVSSARAAAPVRPVSGSAGDTVGRERAYVAVPGREHDGDPVGAQPSRRRPAPLRRWPGRATARRR